MPTNDLRFQRLRVRSSRAREHAWLVGTAVATRAEVADALATDDAVRWIRFCGMGVSDALREAIVEGAVLLLVEPAAAVAGGQAGPSAVDLGEFAQAEPLMGEDDAEPEPELHYVEVLVVDGTGTPLPGIAYELTFPDGTVTTGRTGSDGMVQQHGLASTQDCRITFPEHTKDHAA